MSALPFIDHLEPRVLASSVFIHKGALIVRGDATSSNNVTVGGSRRYQIRVALNGTRHFFSASRIKRIHMEGGSTDDLLRIREFRAIPSILIGHDGNDVLIGGSAADLLLPGPGNDLVNGGSGDDVALGGAGKDTLSGGSGNDLFFAGPDPDSLDGGEGNDTLFGIDGMDTIMGGDGNDQILAGPAELANGGPGNDAITGTFSNDTLIGGGGTDVIGHTSLDNAKRIVTEVFERLMLSEKLVRVI